MGLSDGRKSFPIGLAVLIQYRSVTDTQPPSHVAVAITLNAQASSLKSTENLVEIGQQTATQCLFELCTPRTHSAPDSERERQKKNKQSDKHIFAPTAGARCMIFPKFCRIIEDVETIKKLSIMFSI